MNNYSFFLTSSLSKVFPDKRPPLFNQQELYVIIGEMPAIQLVYYKEGASDNIAANRCFTIEVIGAPVEARLRKVGLVPSDFPAYEQADEQYITTQPGLFPDLLSALPNNQICPIARQYRSLWIDFPQTNKAAPGEYQVCIKITAEESTDLPNGTTVTYLPQEETHFTCCFTMRVLDAELLPQTLLHTEWFHADGLAHYYNMPVFSEKHWQTIENQIALAGKELGVNMLLTPVFTPPLDTAVGHERLTVQLVDITKEGKQYRFGFDKLERWCKLCHKYGITHIEVAHFFTQWGAHATPKIMATINGEEKRIFGWDVPSTSPKYRAFLQQFVPALQEALLGFGYDNSHVVYHISDEPNENHIESYKAAKAQVIDLLEGCDVMDALSDYTYYENGLVTHPVPSNDHIEPFVQNKVPDLWVYYCCGQYSRVPNRFLAMPSARNRIMGVLLYLYDIKGFLHWGYNFYNSQYSLKPINPYVVTHAGYAFPSGDAYLVYPGENGEVLSSIRAQVQRQALDDLASLQLLESYVGRQRVEQIIYDGAEEPYTFKSYPTDEAFFDRLKERVAEELAQAAK